VKGTLIFYMQSTIKSIQINVDEKIHKMKVINKMKEPYMLMIDIK